MNKKISLSALLLISVLYACSGEVPNNIKPSSQVTNNTQKSSYLEINGKVEFPELKFKTKSFKLKFNTKAIPDELSSNTTVSIINPSDSSENPNKVISTGLTNQNGKFKINMSENFTPVTGKILVLEASRRAITNDNQIMTVRTFIRWDGTKWESITQNDILINDKTTAISIISSYKPDLLSSASTINTVDSDLHDINTITADKIDEVAKLVSSVLQRGRDPFAEIKLTNTATNIYSVDQTKNLAELTQTNSCSGCDLKDLDLTNTNLSNKDLSFADLSGKDLTNKDLSNTILVGADLRNTQLPDDLSYMNLSDANLSGQNLTQKIIQGTNLSYTNLSNSTLSTSANPKDLTKTRFTGANFTNAELTNSNMTKVYLFETIMNNTKISGVNFAGSDLTSVDLSNVANKDFSGVTFNETKLIGAGFKNMDLTNIDLSNSNIENADFSKSTINNKKLNNKLKNCNFTEAIIEGDSTDTTTPTANFSDLDYSGAVFEKAKLKNINFNNVDCRQCDFFQTELENVNFYNSNLESTNFDATSFKSDINIKNSDMQKVNFNNIVSNFTGGIDASDISGGNFNNSNIPNFSFNFRKADNSRFSNSTIYLISQNTMSVSNPLIKYDVLHYDSVNYTENYPYITDRYTIDLIYPPFQGNFSQLGGITKSTKSTIENLTCEEQPYLSPISTKVNIIGNFNDYINNLGEQVPSDSVKNISIKNTKLVGIRGHFINSDFSSSFINEIIGYFYNSKFNTLNSINLTGSSIRDSVIINSNFINTNINNIESSYFKTSTISSEYILSSLFVDSSVNMRESGRFSIHNSNVSGADCSTTGSESIVYTKENFSGCLSKPSNTTIHEYKRNYYFEYFIPQCIGNK